MKAAAGGSAARRPIAIARSHTWVFQNIIAGSPPHASTSATAASPRSPGPTIVSTSRGPPSSAQFSGVEPC
jgi:hypothetical protein